jgi:hypothetical protein
VLSQCAHSSVRTLKRDTLIAALETYLADLRRHNRDEAADAAEGRFRTALEFNFKDRRYGDPLAELQLEQATQDDFLEWRDRPRPGRLLRTVNRLVRAEEGVAFFNSQTKDKLPSALLFAANEQKPWRPHMWAQEVRAAIAAQNKTARGLERIPAEASAYSFRHARISELLQVYGVDPLTVAAQTGTSLRMIERAYFKFIRSVMLDKCLPPSPVASAMSG